MRWPALAYVVRHLPWPTRPGDPGDSAHYDYADVRNGVANLFMFSCSARPCADGGTSWGTSW